MMDGKNFQIVTKNTTIPQNVEMDIIASAYIYILYLCNLCNVCNVRMWWFVCM